MTNKKRIGQGIHPETAQTLKGIAAGLGYWIGRGTYASDGSINQLNEAIANGELLLTRYPKDRAAWDAVRKQFVDDAEMLDYLLDFYLERRLPLHDDDSDPILGWNRIALNTEQPCYECDQPVSGDCYQVMGKTLFAHLACIDD